MARRVPCILTNRLTQRANFVAFRYRAQFERLLLIAFYSIFTPTAVASDPVPPPVVRFLLTFDDGPSAAAQQNSTRSILEQLQTGVDRSPIKAVFFVQTRNPKAGGSEIGRELLNRMASDGHVLALHSGTARGHINHTRMPLAELEESLRDGRADIQSITGVAPNYVRPPYWSFNDATLQRYRANDLRMLLDDVAVGDGKVRGISANWRRGATIQHELKRVVAAIEAGEIPLLNDVYPVVVTFHDTNPSTAKHLADYLRLLVEHAHRLGLRTAAIPFFSRHDEVEEVLALRALVEPYSRTSLAPARHAFGGPL